MKTFFSCALTSIIILATAVIMCLFIVSCSSKPPVSLIGAGASFPFPIYSVWVYNYSIDPNHHALINYQSIGSGAGIKQVSEGTVNFGGTDEPLTIDELKKRNLFQMPMVAGSVAIGFNIKGVKNLKLDADTTAAIFLGEITKWNDSRIQKLNDSVVLPNLNITIVYRADGSGTTWLFTTYLSTISNKWDKNIGAAKVVSWPVGIGSKGNEGVAVNIQQVNGSIGYLEAAYAEENHINVAILKNADGNYVLPNVVNVEAAMQNVKWDASKGFYQTFINIPGKSSWPIIGVSYILIPRTITNEQRQTLYNYLTWCYTEGASMAKEKGYVVPPTFDVKDQLPKG